jgi:hypothetical protein
LDRELTFPRKGTCQNPASFAEIGPPIYGFGNKNRSSPRRRHGGAANLIPKS